MSGSTGSGPADAARLGVGTPADEGRADVEAHLRAVLDSEMDARVLVVPCGGDASDLMIAEANHAALAESGRAADEIIGRRLVEAFPVHAAAIEKYLAAMAAGKPLSIDGALAGDDQGGRARRIDVRAVPVDGALTITWRWTPEQSLLAHELADSQALFRLVATSTSDILALGNAAGFLTWVSPSLTRALGWLPEQWIGQRAQDFVHPDDRQNALNVRKEVFAGAQASLRIRLRAVDGAYHWAESRGAPVMDETGKNQGMLATVTIIDDQVAWENKLKHAASHDPLTGLLTRQEAYSRLSAMAATEELTFLAFLDMDNLKEVNDTLGHIAGDELLQVVARRATTVLPANCHIARLGGDEMLVVLPGMPDADTAVAVMQHTLEALIQPHLFAGSRRLRPALSIGMSMMQQGDDVEKAVHRADTAMYQAKVKGGNQISADL